jgi:alpha-methylacyl-CoA racemase
VPGPLSGYKVIELAGLGPCPFAAMLLTDLGAEVLRIDRPNSDVDPASAREDVMLRGRRSVALDLKSAEGVATFLSLVERADAVIEGFRPGVMERLGIGPDECLRRNPRLIFGRMTGFGQDGPYATAAGHDINYIALAGALAHIGTRDAGPVMPLNLLGDFGGGGMFLTLGVLAALLERAHSGRGQVVDTAMVDGTAVLMTMLWGYARIGKFDPDHLGENLLDGGTHYYRPYRCADGKYVSIGSIEPKFYAELLRLTGIDGESLPDQQDRSAWRDMSERLEKLFAQRTRREWCEIMEYTDVCFAPILTMAEAAEHPHNVQRRTFVESHGVTQPAPAPRFSRTAATLDRAPAIPGEHTRQALLDWGIDPGVVDDLIASAAASEYKPV